MSSTDTEQTLVKVGSIASADLLKDVDISEHDHLVHANVPDHDEAVVAEVTVAVPLYEHPEETSVTATSAVEFAEETYRMVKKLNIDDLERGAVHRLYVKLVEDSISRPISVPVLVARGASDGPVFGLTAALHGNEVAGIPVILNVINSLDMSLLKGTVVAVLIANVPGYLQNKREYDGQDLNRIMPGKPKGSATQLWCHNLLTKIISKMDYLLDLHTASLGRVNSLYVRADMRNDLIKEMALLLSPQIIVHNSGIDGSLRSACANMGIPCVVVEIGNPSQLNQEYIQHTSAGIVRIMQRLNMVSEEDDALSDLEDDEGQPYVPVVCTSSFWMFTTRGGILEVYPSLGEWVTKGHVIARVFSIFGEVMHEYEAPKDGIVVGKSINPSCEQGGRILHLGIIEGSGSDFADKTDDGHQ